MARSGLSFRAVERELDRIEREAFSAEPGRGPKGLEGLRARRRRLLALLRDMSPLRGKAWQSLRERAFALLTENVTYHLPLEEGLAYLRGEDNPKLFLTLRGGEEVKRSIFLGLHTRLWEDEGLMLSAAHFLSSEVGEWHAHPGREVLFTPGSAFEVAGLQGPLEVSGWVAFPPRLLHRHRAEPGDFHAVIKGPDLQVKLGGGRKALSPTIPTYPYQERKGAHPFLEAYEVVGPAEAVGRAALAVVWALEELSLLISLARVGRREILELAMAPYDLLLAREVESVALEGKAYGLFLLSPSQAPS